VSWWAANLVLIHRVIPWPTAKASGRALCFHGDSLTSVWLQVHHLQQLSIFLSYTSLCSQVPFSDLQAQTHQNRATKGGRHFAIHFSIF
jgi:hypothetical protein